jgi:hypothetical protein
MFELDVDFGLGFERHGGGGARLNADDLAAAERSGQIVEHGRLQRTVKTPFMPAAAWPGTVHM